MLSSYAIAGASRFTPRDSSVFACPTYQTKWKAGCLPVRGGMMLLWEGGCEGVCLGGNSAGMEATMCVGVL